jgi:hypothetical protein
MRRKKQPSIAVKKALEQMPKESQSAYQPIFLVPKRSLGMPSLTRSKKHFFSFPNGVWKCLPFCDAKNTLTLATHPT